MKHMYPRALGCAALLFLVTACRTPPPAWEAANPIKPLPAGPLGTEIDLASLQNPPTPERVRLGRWLFFDRRLSGDNTISCSSCHRPENAFSEPTPVSSGIRNQRGGRKAPSFVNQAVTLFPHFFWDGRAGSLEDQALGPIANPIEMGNTHQTMIATLTKIPGYAPYFKEAFGTSEITKERVAKAIADYERTRMSGNSPWDRWRYNHFTDGQFHNLGVGWTPETKTFKDEGRWAISKDLGEEGRQGDRGAFKTPTVREVTKHAPYMHDGSVATLRQVVEFYNKGGEKNPWLDPKVKPLKLTDAEIDALVAFMQALDGEGYQDTPPAVFPQ